MGSYKSDQRNAKFYGLKLSRNTDAAMIQWLDSQESVQGYLKGIIKDDMIKKGENTMKKSEIIRENLKAISEAMIERYKIVLKCHGQVQYKIYIWEDGEIECLEGPQGDNSRLAPRQNEPRKLFYVTTVDHPFFDPWDMADHSAPDDDAEREAEEADIIDWCVDSYEEALPDKLDTIIAEAEDEEMDD